MHDKIFNLIECKKDVINLKNKIQISFEFFPPKNTAIDLLFINSIRKLKSFNPNFFSVTHSVNTLNKNDTFMIVQKIRKMFTEITVAPHLTSIGYTTTDLRNIAIKYWAKGIKNIVALRGDIPLNYRGDKIYAVDLIKQLKYIADFNIFVAAYPEIHPEAVSSKHDLINLKNKMDVGAEHAITQFFFSIEKFLRFRDNCHKNHIYIDIIPGILPILDIQQLKKFSNMTNVYIPKYILDIFNKNIMDKKNVH
ncbi:5,10-methylenetetrahydrofolate reductase [Buchnera aphidicola (Cinara tujafilina)]|uniref:Methylenetetrahydrofolate reductase n=1 Tax=Buchnera aphidicola (Cinara tujafilina) TaxID=261317 RepID=F7WYX5_9GAMM|nr:methylenetetrahydrofolate reductase [Buchnera aphidicola]AEH39625.1 5,10-methylenetetrahydrofolate reductase [Buchnera aphidicola (Cinara tujafilina)]